MFQPQHPIAQKHEKIVSEEIKSMLADNVIEPCVDPKGWNSPVFIVEKSDGSPRFIVNFKRTLNMALTEEDTFVMPSADEMLKSIGIGNKFFGALDFKSGYWQIGLDKKDRHKTSFCWKGRNYQFCRIPFGLKTSGNIFSRAVNTALSDVSTKPGFKLYVDDVFLHCKTFDEYFSLLQQVLQGCVKYNIKMSGKKCKILVTEAVFLGRNITSTGYEPIPDYVQGISDMPAPTSRVKLQRLIGRLVWVRSHLEARLDDPVADRSFASLIKPMSAILREKRFIWTQKAQRAFDFSKERLKSAPTFRFADFDRPFIAIFTLPEFFISLRNVILAK